MKKKILTLAVPIQKNIFTVNFIRETTYYYLQTSKLESTMKNIKHCYYFILPASLCLNNSTNKKLEPCNERLD